MSIELFLGLLFMSFAALALPTAVFLELGGGKIIKKKVIKFIDSLIEGKNI